MIRLGSARPGAAVTGGDVALACGVSVLVLLGYLAGGDLRIPAALVAAVLVAAWGIAATQRPRVAVALSFPALLVAGTKFRTRDADASLAGAVDAQILFELLLFAVIAVGLAAAWFVSPERWRVTRAEKVVAGYAALALLSTLWSSSPALTLVRATQLAVVAGLAIAAVRLLGPPRVLWTASRAVALHVLVFASLAIVFPWASTTFEYPEGFRFTWLAMHPIDAGTLAAVAALGVTSAIVFARSGDAPTRVGLRLPLLAGVLVAILLLTSSRGPTLAFVSAAAVLWLMRVRPPFRVAVVMVAAAIGLSGIVFASELRGWLDWLAGQNTAVGRAFFRGQSADTVLEMNGRLALWTDLQPTIVGHLLTGYGYQASRAVLLDAAPWAAYAHNALLQTVLDLGVCGTTAMVVLIAMGFSAAFDSRLDARTRGTIAAVMAFLAVNSVSTESFAGPPAFETLLLFTCVLCTASPRSSATPRGVGSLRTPAALGSSAHPHREAQP